MDHVNDTRSIMASVVRSVRRGRSRAASDLFRSPLPLQHLTAVSKGDTSTIPYIHSIPIE